MLNRQAQFKNTKPKQKQFFMDFISIQELIEEARSPPDLKSLLTKERIATFQKKCSCLKLLYATERVSEKIVQKLYNHADRADVLQKMEAMQAGEKINVSENKKVLHTATRDFFFDKKRSPCAQNAIFLAQKEMEKLKSFLETIPHYTEVVLVGIGGSSLGPEAIYHALEAFGTTKRRAHFLSNIDPDNATRILNSIDLSKTAFIIVSKSGTTLETKVNETIIRQHLKKEHLDPINHCIAVTEKGSPMDNPLQYKTCFYIWDYIGGRYSITSMVGGVLLGLTLGFEVFLEFLKGASYMDTIALQPYDKNLPLLGALLGIWNRNYLQHETSAIIPYTRALSRFPAYLQQLFMESNGKKVNIEGSPISYPTTPIVWGEPGSDAQHSFFQAIHQGQMVIPLEMIGFATSQYNEDVIIDGSFSQEKLLGNLFAQAIGLAQGSDNPNPNKQFPGNRPSHILLGEKLDPYTMGAVVAYYEHKTVFQGFIWNINSFDQEGVQLGKVLATEAINSYINKRNNKQIKNKIIEAYLQ
jgi:glucose-6-phosphate isomerase